LVFQIETKRIFSLAEILTNSDKIIFVSKNWPSDPSVGCSSTSSLIELIEADLALKEEYEGEFEEDDFLDL
jgi:hypothetical protein